MHKTPELISIGGIAALGLKEISSRKELEKELKNVIALIDFSTPWYAPCCLQKPIIQQIATQFEGRVFIAWMNIEKNRDLALTLRIQSIPTLIIFKNGKEMHRFVGLQPESSLSEALSKILK